jgi:signal transduction histidine kinase
VAHSRARRVWVRAGGDEKGYWIEVRDDGEGFDPSEPAPDGHLGLRALRDLLADAGGRLMVHSRPGEGSLVRGELPLG